MARSPRFDQKIVKDSRCPVCGFLFTAPYRDPVTNVCIHCRRLCTCGDDERCPARGKMQ